MPLASHVQPAAMSPVVVPTIDHLLNTHPCSQLDLSRNNLGPNGAEALAPALVKTALTVLDVRGNFLSRKDEALLQQAVQGRSRFDLKV